MYKGDLMMRMKISIELHKVYKRLSKTLRSTYNKYVPYIINNLYILSFNKKSFCFESKDYFI